MKISLCILAYNSERYVAESVGNMVGFVDEIIVALDSRTVDETYNILNNFVTKIVPYTWNHNYSDAKNFCKSHATGDWIIVYDADEKMSEEHIKILIDRIKNAPQNVGAIRIPRKNHYPDWTYDEDNYMKEFYPDPHIIAFRNIKGLDYCGRVHEGIEPNLRNTGLLEQYFNDINTHHHAFKGNRIRNEQMTNYYYQSLGKNDYELNEEEKKSREWYEKEYGR